MDEALKIIQNEETDGYPAKTSNIIFIRKYKPLEVWDEKINYTSLIKYLSTHLDEKLNWSLNLDEKKNKCYISMEL